MIYALSMIEPNMPPGDDKLKSLPAEMKPAHVNEAKNEKPGIPEALIAVSGSAALQVAGLREKKEALALGDVRSLHLDDETMITDMMEHLLPALGMKESITAVNLADAVQKIEAAAAAGEHIDLAIVDNDFPAGPGVAKAPNAVTFARKIQEMKAEAKYKDAIGNLRTIVFFASSITDAIVAEMRAILPEFTIVTLQKPPSLQVVKEAIMNGLYGAGVIAKDEYDKAMK